MEKFKVVVADVRWYYSAYRSPNPVPTSRTQLKLDEWGSLDIAGVCADDCVCLIQHAVMDKERCEELLLTWGFSLAPLYKNVCPDDEDGDTLLPSGWMMPHDRVSVGLRGDPKPPEKKHGGIYELAERFPGPYLSVFANQYREGWVCLSRKLQGGNDVNLSLELIKWSDARTAPIGAQLNLFPNNEIKTDPKSKKRRIKNTSRIYSNAS